MNVEGVAVVLLSMLLAWAPLPYASNRPWSWALVAAGTGLVALVAGVGLALRRGEVRLPWVVLVAGLLTAGVVGWVWVQTLPVEELGRVPFRVAGHPAWEEASAAGVAGEPLVGVGAEAGRDALVRLLAYAGVFWLAFVLAQARERARGLAAGFLVVSAVYAGYGLFNDLAGLDTVLWESEPKANAGVVTSTFIGRAHYATYANLGVLAALCLVLEPFLQAKGLGDARRIAAEMGEKLLAKRGPLLVVLVLTASAMLLTESRGGLGGLAAAVLAVLLLVLAVTRPPLGVLLAAILGTVIVSGALLLAVGSATVERVGEVDDVSRAQIYEDTLAMIRARPELGHGYGTYEKSFQPYQALSAGPEMTDKAHNTYLEHAAELGWPAAVALYAGPVLMFLHCVRGVLRRRREQVFPLLAVGATVAVAVQSMVDFSLQIPAVAVTYAAILGVGVAQSVPSAREREAGAGGRRRERHGASLRD